MPDLRRIIVQDFRNIELQELEFCPNLNCIFGGNAQGKTNLLDAIFYLSMTKSPFSNSDKYNYRQGCDSFGISGLYNINGLQSRFSLKVGEGEKKLLRDDKPYNKICDHIGVLPVVMVCPADSSLVSEGGDERRKFANAVISQLDREYLSDLLRYNKLLAHRNIILKTPSPDRAYLETVDLTMSDLASRIYKTRKDFVSKLDPAVRDHYSELSQCPEKVGITYKSDIENGTLKELFEESFNRDCALHYTTCGIQRDDFLFTMDSEPIRKVGSQGQQKSFLVSLKFAQYDIMRSICGFPPILLLDDLFDKLDLSRTENLLRIVAGRDFGQIFITDTDKARLQGIISCVTKEESCFFEALSGEFRKV